MASTNCDGGGKCERRAQGVRGGSAAQTVPLQCEPGQHARAPGADCLGDDDCASNACDGASITSFDPTDGGLCGTTFPDAGATCFYGALLGGHCR